MLDQIKELRELSKKKMDEIYKTIVERIECEGFENSDAVFLGTLAFFMDATPSNLMEKLEKAPPSQLIAIVRLASILCERAESQLREEIENGDVVE